MRHHRFIGAFDLDVKRITVHDAALANQLGNVFRLQAGDEVVLCDGKGREAVCGIISIGKADLAFDVRVVTPIASEPRTHVTLYASLIKRENFELIVQKAVEAGVSRIVPVIARRSIKQDPRTDRLAKIAREAAEQSGRGIVPEIADAVPFNKALKDGLACDMKVICDFGGKEARTMFTHGGGSVALFIGPEGGWDPEESTLARTEGYAAADLGALTLRAETAAIIATWLAAR
ncbi:MAG: hypothetical protein RLZZ324_128 [Candidatus Parcubacteria bacterium]|jgi:16S rRNA (uracil1498-N3)-methyltransferase